MTPPAGRDRADELAAALDRVRARVAAAARAAARDPAELTLVAVSKTWPAADVLALSRMGVTDFAENRDQEARGKVAEVNAALAGILDPGRDEAASSIGPHGVASGERRHSSNSVGERCEDDYGYGARNGANTEQSGIIRSNPPGRPSSSVLRWHFVGQLQRNKARSVAGYADWVHSVDRAQLVEALAHAAVAAQRELRILVQVRLDPPRGDGGGAAGAAPGKAGAGVPGARGGAAPEDVPRIAALVAASPPLRLAGLMAVAPPDQPPRQAFSRLRELSERLREHYPGAVAISAGMSGDLEAAVAEGATHLRIGAALFGRRLIVP